LKAAALRGRAERPDYRPGLGTLEMPVLVCTGSEDAYSTAAITAALLARIGPDPLRPDASPASFFTKVRRSRSSIAALLMDQSVVSGIGNIWRCETLFVRRMDPFRPLGEVSADELDGLVTTASSLMDRAARPQASIGRLPGWWAWEPPMRHQRTTVNPCGYSDGVRRRRSPGRDRNWSGSR